MKEIRLDHMHPLFLRTHPSPSAWFCPTDMVIHISPPPLLREPPHPPTFQPHSDPARRRCRHYRQRAKTPCPSNEILLHKGCNTKYLQPIASFHRYPESRQVFRSFLRSDEILIIFREARLKGRRKEKR